MASEESGAAAPSPHPAPAARRPRWLRWIAFLIIVPAAAFALVVLLGIFAPKPKPTDATSVLRELANDPALVAKAGMEGKFAETGAPGAPSGIRAQFLWTERPGRMDVDFVTFDTRDHALAGFEAFKDAGSLLAPLDAGDSHFSGFEQDFGSPAAKRFYCLDNDKGYACGSISGELPVIVILRQPPEGPLPPPDRSDPMGGFALLHRSKSRTERMTREMREIDAFLPLLGITAQPATP